MTPDPNTLDPAEIVKLPVDRSKPLNGLTEAQVRALGEDPQQVEAARLAHHSWAGQKQREENVQLVAAARNAVESGELTQAEAAEALRAAGKHEALDAFVTLWQDDERWYAEQEAAEALPWMDASEYAMRAEAQRQQEYAAAEAEADSLRRHLAAKQVEELQSDLKETLGGHALEPQVEQRLVDKLKASGVLPTTAAERATFLEEAIRETAVLGDAMESIRQQVRTESRLHRKAHGARDGLMTQGDIDRATAIFEEQRLAQLLNERMIDTSTLKAQPSAEEESAALAEKYRSRQQKSTDFHTAVGDITKRAAAANADRDRGTSITAERQRYLEVMRRAEDEAQLGNAEIKSGYGANAVQAKAGGYGPDGTWPDELGPAI